MFDWAYKGVDFELAGNGGIECRDFLSVKQRIIETVLASLLTGYVAYIAVKRLTLPKYVVPTDKADRYGKQVLLVVMTLTFGIELGFKLATNQMIYVMNPCHIATMMQIFCLAAPPSRIVTAVFRLHLHMLTGAPIAVIFPVINTRLLPFEVEVYYIQHILMLIIPVYLLRIGGVYTAEPVSDLKWYAMTMGWMYTYHFIPMQYLAYISMVNINNMLCPAVSDPFYGPWYRICAMTHQAMAMPLVGKLLCWSAGKSGLSKSVHIPEEKILLINWKEQNSQEDSAIHEQTKVVMKEVNGRNGSLSSNNTQSRKQSNGHAKKS